MVKKVKPIFLPRDPKAYWSFTASKLLMILILFIYICFISIWTIYTMKYFKNKIEDINEKNPYGNFKSTSDTINYILSGRQIQKLQTHRHFFLFTALFLLGSTAIAIYGIVREMISLTIGFILMQLLSIAFEYVGAIKSDDEKVIKFKLVSLSVQPFLIILAAIYVIMMQKMQQKLASEPTYRQTIIGVVPNLNKLDQVFSSNETKNEVHLDKEASSLGANVNLALNLDDE